MSGPAPPAAAGASPPGGGGIVGTPEVCGTACTFAAASTAGPGTGLGHCRSALLRRNLHARPLGTRDLRRSPPASPGTGPGAACGRDRLVLRRRRSAAHAALAPRRQRRPRDGRSGDRRDRLRLRRRQALLRELHARHGAGTRGLPLGLHRRRRGERHRPRLHDPARRRGRSRALRGHLSGRVLLRYVGGATRHAGDTRCGLPGLGAAGRRRHGFGHARRGLRGVLRHGGLSGNRLGDRLTHRLARHREPGCGTGQRATRVRRVLRHPGLGTRHGGDLPRPVRHRTGGAGRRGGSGVLRTGHLRCLRLLSGSGRRKPVRPVPPSAEGPEAAASGAAGPAAAAPRSPVDRRRRPERCAVRRAAAAAARAARPAAAHPDRACPSRPRRRPASAAAAVRLRDPRAAPERTAPRCSPHPRHRAPARCAAASPAGAFPLGYARLRHLLCGHRGHAVLRHPRTLRGFPGNLPRHHARGLSAEARVERRGRRGRRGHPVGRRLRGPGRGAGWGICCGTGW
ncbi:hypothetical protein ACU686_40860 [Yinghuangia aomiensis]